VRTCILYSYTCGGLIHPEKSPFQTFPYRTHSQKSPIHTFPQSNECLKNFCCACTCILYFCTCQSPIHLETSPFRTFPWSTLLPKSHIYNFPQSNRCLIQDFCCLCTCIIYSYTCQYPVRPHKRPINTFPYTTPPYSTALGLFC